MSFLLLMLTFIPQKVTSFPKHCFILRHHLPIQAREAASRASNKKLLEALTNINKTTTITGQNASIQSPTQIPIQSKEDESTQNIVPSEQNVAVQNPYSSLRKEGPGNNTLNQAG